MITVTDLGMHYGPQTLFSEASLQLNKGQRVGIVGANGSGKSTLLRILSGEEGSSEGDVARPRNCRIGVLGQDHFQYDDTRILEVVMMGNEELWSAMVEKEKVLDNAENHFDEDRYVELEDIVLRFDGYGLEARAGEILEGLGIPTAKHNQPLKTLSGGYKLRALLGQTLASDPDVLFLDEPTNHLDILAIRWLESFLHSFKGLVVVVSHDLHFLDSVATHIVDVDYERVTVYKGNYSAFTRQKVEERTRREGEISKREKEIAEHKVFIQRFKAKATKARQANSRQKRMEKIVIDKLPISSRRHPKFRFAQRRPSGREVLKVRGIAKSFGELQVLDGVEFDVTRGERVAIVGANGVGKSTLLKILIGQLEADAGTYQWGHEVDVGYFPQDHHEALGSGEDTLIECLWEVCPEEALGNVIGRLAAVLFDRDDCDKKVRNLSGGEAARLLFSRLAVQASTVMALDEPTNHLDIEGIEALSKSLKAYKGTLFFVSHDRWFVDRVATRIIELKPDGMTDFRGSWSEYLARSGEDHLDRDRVVQRARKSRRKGKRG